ncbi:hypothetical protein BD410DRAFT_847074 [Rickenella mellea]|uniref:Uncharacterized protein n=1 Tax=Rickenella mellea TaxID=50990 RepID=A0A4Y7PFQ6_9AGAM|nr:hypothetical protein BD410DRAFT_847074 [Rickenella mellea]
MPQPDLKKAKGRKNKAGSASSYVFSMAQAQKALIRARECLQLARANRDRDKARESKAREELRRAQLDVAVRQSGLQDIQSQCTSAQRMVNSLRDEYRSLRDICHNPSNTIELPKDDDMIAEVEVKDEDDADTGNESEPLGDQ